MTEVQIVRVLWGDDRPGCRWGKVWRKDVEPALRRAERCPFSVWCYGRGNADLLTGRGVPVELVDPEPFPDGAADRDGGSTWIRPWHYKHQLLAAAVRRAPTIYLDWDVRIVASAPEVLGDALGDSAARLSAYIYKRPRAALLGDQTRRDRRLTPSGNWIYAAGPEFPERVLAAMRSAPAGSLESWHDEHAMKAVIGGWPGDEEWLREWESPLMVQRGGRCPWPLASKSEGPTGLRTVRRETPVNFEWTEAFAQ